MALLSLSLLLSCILAEADDRPGPPAPIFRHWMHSHEEDAGGVEVYRPAEYDFPASRGREGFEMKRGGEFVAHEIAPGDGTELVKGRWRSDDPGVIDVTFPDAKPKEFMPGVSLGPPKPRTLRVISCDDRVLKLKARLPQAPSKSLLAIESRPAR